MTMTLRIETPDKTIAVVTLNRPQAANALNTQMALDLKAFFVKASTYRAIILTGSGTVFCAGADLKERQGMNKKAWHTQHRAFEAALKAILRCDVPVIAAVNGAAYAGGLELALACDFIYAADSARFALTEVTLGIMPGLGGTQNLPRRLGLARAKEIIFTGKPFPAAEASEWGLINKLCSDPVGEALATARLIAANAPRSVKAIKKAMNQGITLPLDKALACELKNYNTLLSTKDRQEGLAAWSEKRKPVFTGE